MKMARSFLVIVMASLAGTAVAAQKTSPKKATPSPSPAATPSPAPTPSPMSPACTGPQYRQFDFWLGEWDLVGADGKKSAEDKVAQVLAGAGCKRTGPPSRAARG